MSDVRRIEDEHAAGGVTRRPVTIVRGEGALLWDADGKRYLDCGSAHGWANLGHCHPDVVRAIREQAGRLVTLNESAYNDVRARWFATLATRLAKQFVLNQHGGLSRIFPCNSGTEAIEAALKLARLKTGRTGFVAFRRGFHGRTMGALSVTATAQYRSAFAPLVAGVTHVAYNDLEAIAAAVSDHTAAVVVEIVQGEGGVHEATRDFVTGLQQVCRERGTLLIVDEVQTGLGRTGRWFASEHVGAQPDILVLGKALGAGIPMAATVWRGGLGGFDPGLHGSTFGGAPLACAASVAGLEVLARDDRIARTAERGAGLLEEFTGCAPIVRAVRGKGFMIGIELRRSVTPVLKALMERGVWALPAGKTVLRLLPPLVMTDEQLAEATSIIVETLRAA